MKSKNKCKSTIILLNNLTKHFNVSRRGLGKKINYSVSIILNWSNGRTSPSLDQLNTIAYELGVNASQLLIEDNMFSIDTPIWRDNLKNVVMNNIGRLKLENDIHEKSYYDNGYNEILEYRSFLKYLNGHNKKINLVVLEKLAIIYKTEPYKLLESEEKL